MSSTFFPESGDLASVSKKPACAQSGSAKSIRSAMPSYGDAGQAFPSTLISDNLTVPNMPDELMSSAAAIPANLSAWQDKDVARLMKDISGRRCLDSYEKSGRDGSLPRMLLDTLISVSTRLPHRWSLKASPSGRLIFALLPLTRTIVGKGYGLLPTPTASDCKGASVNCRKLIERDLSYLRFYLHFHVKPDYSVSYPHPSFVEGMMGYPIGHTDLGLLETRSFRKSRSSLAKSSPNTMPPQTNSINNEVTK